MTHLFQKMYSDEVQNIKNQLTPGELTAAIVIELIKRKMDEIEMQQGNPTIPNEKTVTSNERCCWWSLADQASNHIDKEHAWKLILEAFKLHLNRQDPPIHYTRIFEQTFKPSYLGLHTIHSDIHKTVTFVNLMDYIICIDKIKYKSSE